MVQKHQWNDISSVFEGTKNGEKVVKTSTVESWYGEGYGNVYQKTITDGDTVILELSRLVPPEEFFAKIFDNGFYYMCIMI